MHGIRLRVADNRDHRAASCPDESIRRHHRQLKVKKALEFLQRGNRVRVMVAFPGRRGFEDAKRMLATLVDQVPPRGLMMCEADRGGAAAGRCSECWSAPKLARGEHSSECRLQRCPRLRLCCPTEEEEGTSVMTGVVIERTDLVGLLTHPQPGLGAKFACSSPHR